MELYLIGLCVAELATSLDYLTGPLGLRAAAQDADWVAFERHGLMLELYDNGPPSGHLHTVAPLWLTDDLVATQVRLTRVELKPSHDGFYFMIPPAIRAELMAAPDTSFPNLGGAVITTHDHTAMQDFYAGVMGLSVARPFRAEVALWHRADGAALLILRPGVGRSPTHPDAPDPLRRHSVFLGFKTDDIQASAARLREHGATILQDVTYHPEWEGASLIIADPDDNTIQVVQYGAL